ncbi:MAG TPA: hypothetical protein VFR24_14860 [Candidatus Angelobacter sp.]|nr:hypothetical protein [Candidatus Angelobacter sp.]
MAARCRRLAGERRYRPGQSVFLVASLQTANAPFLGKDSLAPGAGSSPRKSGSLLFIDIKPLNGNRLPLILWKLVSIRVVLAATGLEWLRGSAGFVWRK